MKTPFDEIAYIRDAMNNVFDYSCNSPLYVLWIKVVSLFTSDIYPVSFILLTIITIVMLFVLNKKMRWYWLLIIIVPFLMPFTLRVSYLAVLIICLFLHFGWNLKLLSLLLTLIRPEFLLTFIFDKWEKKDAYYLIPFALIWIFLGFPWSDGRAEMAIGQHYAFWYSLFNDFPDPWNNWKSLEFNSSMYFIFIVLNSIVALPVLWYFRKSRYILFALPIILSCTFIFPRPHYLFLLVPFMIYEYNKRRKSQ
jgi:hypothetical protein